MTHVAIAGGKVPPASRRPHTIARKYPFDTMKVGDAFFIENRTVNDFASYASRIGRRDGKTFSTRLCWMSKKAGVWTVCKETDRGAVQGIGCWRER